MIEAKNLTKRFGDVVAVDHINATIKEGSVFGLIGTNGAGKSTFLRMLSGILKPDEGSGDESGSRRQAGDRGRRSHDGIVWILYRPSLHDRRKRRI